MKEIFIEKIIPEEEKDEFEKRLGENIGVIDVDDMESHEDKEESKENDEPP